MLRLSIAALVLALVPSIASAQIFQPGTQPVGEEGGITVAVQSSRACRNCHGNYAADADHEPYDSWRGSMMGSAGRDPIALAAIAIAEADHPDAADFCLRCHTPVAWLAGRSSLPEYDDANPDYEERLRPDAEGALSADRDGIACMICHRMVEPPDAAMISNAQLVLADGAEGAVRRGPYEYELGADPRHETAVEPFLSTGALCGSCHDITNPLHDGFRASTAGGALEPTGRRFAIERTYSEWRYSRFAADGETCQTCHMPEVAALAADEGFGVRPQMNRHDLAGGNVWVPRALAAMVRDLDPEAALHLEASALRAGEMLRRAATVEIRASALEGDTATATIRVTNDSGHKLPTGYPEGRRMWLSLEVVDSSGTVVAGSGRYDDETDELERDAQLRTYEVKLGESSAPSFHFVLNDTLLEDTRIPPEGFAPPPEADVDPLGREYPLVDPADPTRGMQHWDETSYTLSNLCGTGTLTLRARLRFQTTTREYIEFLRDEAPPSTDPALAGRSWGDVAYDAWREHGGDQPFDMETVEVELGPAPMACPEPEIDAGIVAIDAGIDAGVDAGEGDLGG
ncbi:MAG: hypothetical protein M3Y87_30140, partial [Myxococcota bacterium]|nr:hypothetical protein [Myxococcota bacterium]